MLILQLCTLSSYLLLLWEWDCTVMFKTKFHPYDCEYWKMTKIFLKSSNGIPSIEFDPCYYIFIFYFLLVPLFCRFMGHSRTMWPNHIDCKYNSVLEWHRTKDMIIFFLLPFTILQTIVAQMQWWQSTMASNECRIGIDSVFFFFFYLLS